MDSNRTDGGEIVEKALGEYEDIFSKEKAGQIRRGMRKNFSLPE